MCDIMCEILDTVISKDSSDVSHSVLAFSRNGTYPRNVAEHVQECCTMRKFTVNGFILPNRVWILIKTQQHAAAAER